MTRSTLQRIRTTYKAQEVRVIVQVLSPDLLPAKRRRPSPPYAVRVPQPQDLVSHKILAAHAQEAIQRLSAVEVVSHPGERGLAREQILRQYLREIVPLGFEVATGFVIDALGGQSRQQDLIIVRKDYHPRFQVGGATFFPVEAVSAVIEVKSTFTAATLREAVANARSVKALDRSGGGQNYIPAPDGSRFHTIGEAHDNHAVQAFIVGGSCATRAESAIATITASLDEHPRTTWPNGVAVADDWYMTYKVPNGEPRSFPYVATDIALLKKETEGNVEPLIDLARDLWWWLRASPVIDARPDSYIKTSGIATSYRLPAAPEL